jgi:hypothetical protein
MVMRLGCVARKDAFGRRRSDDKMVAEEGWSGAVRAEMVAEEDEVVP